MMYGDHYRYISIIHRWKFIYRSNAKKYTLGFAKCGVHNQVVFIFIYIQVVFGADWTFCLCCGIYPCAIFGHLACLLHNLLHVLAKTNKYISNT